MKLPEYNYKRVAAVWMDHYQVNVNLANEKKMQIKNKLSDEQATTDNIKPGLHQTNIVRKPTLN